MKSNPKLRYMELLLVIRLVKGALLRTHWDETKQKYVGTFNMEMSPTTLGELINAYERLMLNQWNFKLYHECYKCQHERATRVSKSESQRLWKYMEDQPKWMEPKIIEYLKSLTKNEK